MNVCIALSRVTETKMCSIIQTFVTDLKENNLSHSSLNVFDDGAVLLLFKFWTFSIVFLFLNHKETIEKVQNLKSSNLSHG
jgi:hypothetical protein